MKYIKIIFAIIFPVICLLYFTIKEWNLNRGYNKDNLEDNFGC
jgi:amino acid transporter